MRTCFLTATLFAGFFFWPHLSATQELEPQATSEKCGSFGGFHQVSQNTLVKYISAHPEGSDPIDRNANRKARKTFEAPKNTPPSYSKFFALIALTFTGTALAALFVFLKKTRTRTPPR